MRQEITDTIAALCQELFETTPNVVLTRPDEQFGDYATNVALQLAKPLAKNPREVAEELAAKLQNSLPKTIAAVAVAGPGFINIVLTDTALFAAMNHEVAQQKGTILLEYSCPNPFKELHVGHLYQTILGDALGRVYKRLGTDVYRVTFGGDVGPHVAKSLWAMLQELGGEHPEKLADIPADQHASWLAKVYIAGSAAYEADEQAKQDIEDLNKRIYELHNSGDKDSAFAQIYWQTRGWSYDYFNEFYTELGVVPFDRFIGESETFKPGTKIVTDNVGPVFEESDGAIVLSKERSGLHTRVFITSKGLPTYEAKDLGVITLEAQAVAYDKRIIMTGNDQKQYMQVVFAALQLINPELGAKQESLTHGTVKFGDGQKMSSRLGNVTRAVDVLSMAHDAVRADNEDTRNQIALGAVKYTFLKNSIGDDIAFDVAQSVSTEGNSGPYLQYALVRARSILRKIQPATFDTVDTLDEHERRLSNWLSRYEETLYACIEQRSLHHLCGYLYELAQNFNRFYEQSRVVGDEREALRAMLVQHYATTLADGLNVLGIKAPEEM